MNRGYAIVGLYAPKSDLNVGGALRAAGCYDASAVVIQGARYRRQPTDTQAAFRHIPLHHAESLLDFMPLDCARVAVDLLPGAHNLTSFRHPERAIYIFGPEDGTLPEAIVAKCHHKVFVPTKFCMNLAATVNVVLYDRMAKSGCGIEQRRRP